MSVSQETKYNFITVGVQAAQGGQCLHSCYLCHLPSLTRRNQAVIKE